MEAMELLVIRVGNQYLRYNETEVTLVGLEKATVCPRSQLASMRAVQTRARAQGYGEAEVRLLVLTETALVEDGG